MAKLYYLTTNGLNGSTVAQLGAARGLAVEVVGRPTLSWLKRQQAEVVLDWDSLPPEDRRSLLAGLLRVVGVHGNGLSDSAASFLPLRGVVVSRHLDDAFIEALAGPRAA